MALKMLIFDFDGTIADTLERGRAVLNQLAAEYKFQPLAREDVERAKGMTLSEFIRFLKVPKRKVPVLLAKGKRLLRQNMDEIQVQKGMDQTLYRLQDEGWHMGILTSNSVENVQIFLDKHALDMFEFVSSVRKLTGKHKYLKAILRTFSLKPEEVLYIGDETRDVRGALKAGVPVVACTWGFNNETSLLREKPTFLIHEPHEIMDLIYNEDELDPVV